jgi:UDP-glucose 4-epimerase
VGFIAKGSIVKVLVTGGAGFIGSHLVDRLIALGHEVRVFDNLSTGKRENLRQHADRVQLVVGDVRDEAALLRASEGVNLVYHEAAVVSVQLSVERPDETLAVNLGGTLNVLRAAKAQGAKRVVLASSAAVYGSRGEGARRESDPTLPESPYGLEKLGSEHYLRMWHELYGLDTVSLRYFNVFGPRQDPSSPYSGVISIFADRLLRGMTPTIYGDGEQTRDFVYVANVVEANICAGLGPATQGTFNVGCGISTSLNQLLKQMGQAVGTEAKANYAEGRAGDIRYSQADITRSTSLLGYVPQVSVQDGLGKLIASLRT